MSRFIGETEFRHDQAEAAGVLLVNLGTPDAPTPAALRRYLGQFLSDPRVVEVPRPLWWLILHGVILRIRPRRSARAYRKVWREDGSPLMVYSIQQKKALQAQLSAHCPGPVHVELAMSYGQPSIDSALRALSRHGVRRLIVLPMYPQYSGSTSASVFDGVTRQLQKRRWLPEFRYIADYAAEPAYIEALATSIRESWQAHGRGQKLLFSFHGVPKRYLLAGDPYHCQCHKTARLVAETLDLAEDEWQLVFQSRFGREEWLQPYADKTLQALPGQGVKRVDVVCPGFSADCLETLEEIAMENRELFLAAGGEDYHYIPALNARADHIAMLSQLLRRHGRGWPEFDGEGLLSEVDLAARLDRAKALGAAG